MRLIEKVCLHTYEGFVYDCCGHMLLTMLFGVVLIYIYAVSVFKEIIADVI